jgi:hypothetical protein
VTLHWGCAADALRLASADLANREPGSYSTHDVTQHWGCAADALRLASADLANSGAR